MPTKIKVILLFWLLVNASWCGAQNLVPNPSFEDYDTCPEFLSQINYAIGWNGARQTPDYYNSCAIPFTVGSVPHNYFGNQYPATGNAYAGIMARFPDDTSWAEALSMQLLNSLLVGQKYYVSFKVSLAVCNNPSLQRNYCGVNKIGALFSTSYYDGVTFLSPRCTYNCAQVYTDTVIKDTLNWVRITGAFVADSNYSFINIGRFNYNSITDTIQISGTECNAYYFIDDVCVSTDSAYTYNYYYTDIGNQKTYNNELINVYPNPVQDFLSIENNGNALNQIDLYNVIGEHIKTYTIMGSQSKNTLDLVDLPNGIYTLIFHTKNFKVIHKSIIKL